MEFGVLGPAEIWVNGRSVDAGHARQRAVLAVLLLEAGRAVPLEALIDRVWGDDPPRSVRNVVYGYVGRLKALITSGQDPEVTLSRRPGGYLLQARPDQVDVRRFRRLVADAAGAAGDDERAGVSLGEAVALWRGTALAGLDSPWLNGQRARLELERAAAVGDLRDIGLRRGEHAALVGELVEQAAGSPADERLIGQLMRALYRCGRQAEALNWFELTRRHLAGELGADPGPELRALHEQILRGDPSLAAVPRAAGRPAVPVPRELPGDVPGFTGRAAELAELDRLLAAPPRGTDAGAKTAGAGDGPVTAAVISAVSGTAGVGKTALAVHWAHRAAERFPDGQLYVNLRGYDPGRPVSAADALVGFLRALGVPGQDIPPGQDERAARYRSLLAGRRMLVVLDNAGEAEQIRPLLPGSGVCAAVVTSRDALPGLVAREGAARLDLDLLPMDEAVGLLRELIGEPASTAPDAVAALAGYCCRLPLALRVAAELVAARRGVPLADLVSELAGQQRRLDLFDAGDPRTAVRAVFSWSCRNLSPDAARTFRFLGWHPGCDFDAYAAAALISGTLDQGRLALAELARAHLVEPAAPGRYLMHDLLRAYAGELADALDSADERHAALTRLFDHYLHAAAAAMDTLYPGERHRRPRIHPLATPTPRLDSTAAAQSWLDEQRAALVAVTVHTAERGWPDHATRLAAILFRYLNLGSHYPEATTIYSHAASAARSSGDPAGEAIALTSLGGIDSNQGRFEQACNRHRQALEMFREAGDSIGQARAMGNLALTYVDLGRFHEAVRVYGEALTVFRQNGDRAGEVRSLCNLGIVEERLGRYQQAARSQEQSLAIAREIGARDTETLALLNLGIARLRLGRCALAAGELRRALALCRENGYRAYTAVALTRMGDVCLCQGSPDDATGYLQEAQALFQGMGDRSGEADTLNSLGEVLIATGQLDGAHTRHAAAFELARPIGDKYQQARALGGLGRAYHAAGDQDQARQHWQQALELFTELGVPEADEVRGHLAAEREVTAAG
jgi:DNA-binding SARP family transcriptional activator/tetratricopeptide (TPR) repeat protein